MLLACSSCYHQNCLQERNLSLIMLVTTFNFDFLINVLLFLLFTSNFVVYDWRIACMITAYYWLYFRIQKSQNHFG